MIDDSSQGSILGGPVSAFPPHGMPIGLEGPAAFGHTLAAAGSGAAVLLIDLVGFGSVNLRDGFAAGDALLARTTQALESVLRGGGAGTADATVLRLAGDEFAVVLPRTGPESLAGAAAALNEAASSASGLRTCCGAVPAVMGPDGVVDVRRTVRSAGLALRAALRAGGGSVRGPDADGGALTTVEEEDLEVRSQLRSGGFALHFQPLVDPVTARPIGVEALVRARATSGGVTGPGVFLPQVRRSGLSVELGTAILTDALIRWQGRLRGPVRASSGGVGDVVLTANVDAEQVEQDGFDGLVLHLLDRSDVPAAELVLEVTESVLTGAAARTRLQRLREAGVRVAIDDFGAGPVVLSEIRTLPVDILKVDQVLVSRLDPERPDVGLIEDLQRLAGLLDLRLAVEAVETPALAARIAELGVPIAQGYHYARPMPPEELVAWLSATSG